jgi:hypothetical protein
MAGLGQSMGQENMWKILCDGGTLKPQTSTATATDADPVDADDAVMTCQ